MSAFSDSVKRVTGGGAAPPEQPPVQAQAPLSAFEAAKQRVTAQKQGALAPRADREAALMKEYSKPQDVMPGNWAGDALIGMGSGFTNVIQGIGNMTGIHAIPRTLFGIDATDEGVAEKKRMDRIGGLDDSTAGSIGEFAGEMAALAPLGAVGGAARLGSVATKLPTAMKILGGAVEGAGAGAILANPNEREVGALVGSVLGGGMVGAGAVAGRVLKKGIAKTSDVAKDSVKYVEKWTGRRPSLPLTVGADASADTLSANAKSFGNAMSLIPAAQGPVRKQIVKLSSDLYEADLRKAFDFNKSVSDRVVAVFRETGDVTKAIEAGYNKNGMLPSKAAKILEQAARNAPEGRYTGKQMLKAAEDAAGDGPLSKATFRDEANLRMKLIPRADATEAGTADLAARDLIRDFNRETKGIVGNSSSLIPYFGKTVGSEWFQNAVQGASAPQRLLQSTIDSGGGQRVMGVVSDARRALSGQAKEDDDPERVKQMLQSLRGN